MEQLSRISHHHKERLGRKYQAFIAKKKNPLAAKSFLSLFICGLLKLLKELGYYLHLIAHHIICALASNASPTMGGYSSKSA